MAGRKTKLTPQVQAIIIETLQGGGYASTASQRAGIDEATLYRWLERGEKQAQGPFREFRDAVKKAEADIETKATALVLKVAFDADNPNWVAAMTFLERRYPQHWGRRDRHELVGDGGGPVKLNLVQFGEDDHGAGNRPAGDQ